MDDEQLTIELLATFRHFLSMDDEGFETLKMAAQDEIDRSMDQEDLVGELRGRYVQAVCDAVARYRQFIR